jgi:CRISPR-associated endonuclease/helicase Cas3
MNEPTSATSDLVRFWGKLGRTKDPHPGFHPLICHMIDVAAVAGRIWDEVLSDPARVALMRGLGLPNEAATRTWVVFLAALHDLGKACPAFTLRKEAQGLRHLYPGLPEPPAGVDAPHGVVTAVALPAALQRLFDVEQEVAKRLALVTGGHHGCFPSAKETQALDGSLAVGRAPWEKPRTGLVEALADLLGVRGAAVPGAVTNAAAMALAGLISVADWLGSDAEHFTYYYERSATPLPELSLTGYFQQAQQRAARALSRHGWTGFRQHERPLAFTSLFDFTPRPLQQAAVELAEKMGGPGIVVVESPMGEGKTEAALYLADRWGVHPGPRGFYIALPTQATSNQMFQRTCRFLAARYPDVPVNVQLLHGHAALSADFELLREKSEELFQVRDVDPEEPLSGVAAAAWFAGGKRGLLAPFGVGTVDQALLAALKTRHVFVRLFGLAHRVVIVDEVHAYDAYMSTLLERVLEWLGALGSPVVLLSATLPRARRDGLIRAYAKGMGVTLDELPQAPYPRLTWLGTPRAAAGEAGHLVGARHVAVERPARTVAVEWIDGRVPAPGEPFPLGERVRRALEGGGCAAVICNTVRRAQQVYRALKPYFPGTAGDGEPELDLLHARFLFTDRQERERRALQRFGKEGPRPDRAVLVATQVIEQSLDVDFDVMVTDLAPADLVLQRLGRLWRHGRGRPPSITRPEVWICLPDAVEEGVPRITDGSRWIYDAHVLLRSWLALRSRPKLHIPNGIEAIVEEVYDDARPCPADAGPALRDEWERTAAERKQALEAEKQEAQDRWLLQPDLDAPLWRYTLDWREEESPELHEKHQALTRLTEPTVQVTALFQTPSGPSLDPGGAEPVNEKQRPNAALARRLLERTVTLSDPRVVHTLMKQEPPSGWQRNPITRNLRLVLLDEHGEGALPDSAWRLRFDREVGVEVVAGEA